MAGEKKLSERHEILREPVEPGTYVPPAKRMDELIKEHTSPPCADTHSGAPDQAPCCNSLANAGPDSRAVPRPYRLLGGLARASAALRWTWATRAES
jgi:hypothetical protein